MQTYINVISNITYYCFISDLTVPDLVVVDFLHGEGRILIEFFMVWGGICLCKDPVHGHRNKLDTNLIIWWVIVLKINQINFIPGNIYEMLKTGLKN